MSKPSQPHAARSQGARAGPGNPDAQIQLLRLPTTRSAFEQGRGDNQESNLSCHSERTRLIYLHQRWRYFSPQSFPDGRERICREAMQQNKVLLLLASLIKKILKREAYGKARPPGKTFLLPYPLPLAQKAFSASPLSKSNSTFPAVLKTEGKSSTSHLPSLPSR